MRRIKDIIFKGLNKKIFHKKLFIKFIVIFSILELMFIPFSVASFTSTDDLDGNTKTAGSRSSLPAVDHKPSDSSDNSIVVDDSPSDINSGTEDVNDSPTETSSDSTNTDNIPTDSNDGSILTNDKTSDTNSNLYILDEKSSENIVDYLSKDNNTIDSIGSSLINDDNFYYAPNERIVSINEIVTKTENTLGDLVSGIETEVKFNSFEDIDSVKLILAENLEKVKVTIIKLKEKPEEIIDPPKKNISIYKYLDIKLVSNDTYVKEDEIQLLEFKFKIEKTWIYENRIDKSTIKLIRYHDGVWQDLSTILNNENETYIYYTALSPGFSTFAVVGSKVVEKSGSYGSDALSISWSIIFALILVLTIMLLFILFKARYIYLKDDNKQR